MQIRYEICEPGERYWEKTQTPITAQALSSLLNAHSLTGWMDWGEGEFALWFANGARLIFRAWQGDPRLIYQKPPKKP